MKSKWRSQQEDYSPISSYSKRAVCVYDEQLMLAKVTFHAKTDDFGFHQHPHRQIVIVEEGEFLFIVDEKEIRLAKGDSLLIEPNLRHGCIPLTIPGQLIDVFTPMRRDFLEREGE